MKTPMDSQLVSELKFSPMALLFFVMLFPAPFVFDLYASGTFVGIALGVLFHLNLLLLFVRDVLSPAVKLSRWLYLRQA
jgi:hypothetical protein